MTNPSSVPSLAQARAAAEAMRSSYLTSNERALADLVLALAQELDAVRRDAMLAGSALAAAPTINLAATADASALRDEVEGLKLTVRQLERDAILRHGGGYAPSARRPDPAPRKYATLEQFAEHLPDFGDSSAPDHGQSYLSQPRVRPQDIQLTDEDYARQRQSPLSQQVTGYRLPSRSLVNQSSSPLVLIGVIALIFFLIIIFLI